MNNLWKMLLTIVLIGMLNQVGFAKVLKGDELRENVIKRLPKLNHTKLEALMQRVGKKPPKNFYNCLCRKDRGGAAPGVGVSYHPEPLKPYDERYSCQHSGPPCMAAGYGCWRFPLPRDKDIWSECIKNSKYDDNSTIIDAIVGEIEVLHKEQNKVKIQKDAEEYCVKFRNKNNKGLLKNIPQEKRIYHLSFESIMQIKKNTALLDTEKFMKEINKYLDAHPNIMPNETDFRIDLGKGEIGLGFDKDGGLIIKELVGKLPNGFEVGVGLEYTQEIGKIKKVQWNGKFKFGFAKETGRLEGKYGIDIDTNKNAQDYYDGDWAKESENRVVRFIENYVSKFDFYIGGALSYGNKNMNIGVESSWNIRQRYSDLLFSDMNKALDDLLENQKNWEKKRHDIIVNEAKQFDIDTRCKTSGQIQKDIWKKWNKIKKSNSNVKRPFSSIKKWKKDYK